MPVYAVIFPGQGSQSVGMGRDLAAAFPAAREVFEEVDEALKQKLSKIIWDGPAETLTLTENAQPALMAVSLAALRALEREGAFSLASRAAILAGHSLGEYTALAAAGAISLADTARLLRRRGQAMQNAVPEGQGAMAALLGIELHAAAALCREAAVLKRDGEPDLVQVVEPANDNGGGQVVISGHAEAVDRAVALAKQSGVKRAMRLPVSAPFHCALMRPAAEVMRGVLAETPIAAPYPPIVANVTASKESEPDTIRDLLVAQVTATVRWRESVLACNGMGIDHFVEIGAGKVLSGLNKRIVPDSETHSVGTPSDLESFLKAL